MKRILTGILTIIFFIVSSGVAVSMHYCMGKMRSAQLQFIASKSCGCKKASNKGCCKTEHQFVKLTDNYKASVIVYQVATPQSLLPATHIVSSENIIKKNQPSFSNHSPPLTKGQEVYLYNCVFRI